MVATSPRRSAKGWTPAGAEVTWLERTDDESLREAVEAKPDVVCVATRDDAFPLRIALLVRHLDEDVPLW